MGKSAPKPTDPRETSAATTGTNVSTAIANNMMGNINEVGPDGSTRVDQTGNYSWVDPYTGHTYNVPTFTRTTELSEAQKAIKGQTDAAELNLAGLANDQSANIRDRLDKPFEYTNRDAENWAFDLASARLLPQQQKNEEALRTRLLNSGIREGSSAWNSEMERLSNANTDQMNQLALAGRQNAYQEARDQYTLPVNTITALLSGSQVSNPNFMGANITPIQGTDNASIIANYDQQRIAAAQQNSLGGLFTGLGQGVGNLLGAGKLFGLSDERAKTDKKKIGEAKGMGLWEFRYKGEPKSQPKHVGLMAQEVEKKRPDAVITGNDGLKRVDYSAALGLMDFK